MFFRRSSYYTISVLTFRINPNLSNLIIRNADATHVFHAFHEGSAKAYKQLKLLEKNSSPRDYKVPNGRVAKKVYFVWLKFCKNLIFAGQSRFTTFNIPVHCGTSKNIAFG